MLYSFAIILILLIIDFRRLNMVLLALMPLFIGMMWLQLALYIFRIDYNVANIAGLPLLLGLGIVYGLRMVHRWREDTTVTAFLATKTTGRGLAFAALAIVAGLISIVPARHNGASAFGMILLIGIISCMFTALVILPAVIDYIYVMRNKDAVSAGAGGATVTTGAMRPQHATERDPKPESRAKYKSKTQKKKTVRTKPKKKPKKKKS